MNRVTSDEIRDFVNGRHIDAARVARQATVTIRAGDVHTEMGLRDQMPHVCSAIGANKFQTAYRVRLLRSEGPHNGANKRFTFEILP